MPGQVGNRGGKKGRSGRKPKAEELGVKLEVFDKGFSQADRVAVIRNLVSIAKSDEDPKAAVSASTLLFGYVFGKPTEKHEHSGADGDAIEIVITHVKTGIKAD